MKDKIQKIIEEDFSSDIRSREVISLINSMLLIKAKECLQNDDTAGNRSVISLFIDID